MLSADPVCQAILWRGVARREAILFDRSIDVLIGRLCKRPRDDSREPQLGEGYVLAAAFDKS